MGGKPALGRQDLAQLPASGGVRAASCKGSWEPFFLQRGSPGRAVPWEQRGDAPEHCDQRQERVLLPDSPSFPGRMRHPGPPSNKGARGFRMKWPTKQIQNAGALCLTSRPSHGPERRIRKRKRASFLSVQVPRIAGPLSLRKKGHFLIVTPPHPPPRPGPQELENQGARRKCA